MVKQIPHAVILGGGFGGLSVANEIRQEFPSTVKITIIDKKNWFMIGFAKLWIMQGKRTFENSTRSLEELRKKSISFLNEEITRLDFENKTVFTDSNRISYDYLVIALGAELAPHKIPGLLEHGLNLYNHNQLSEIHNKITSMKNGKIAIVIMSMPYKVLPHPLKRG